MTYETMKRVQDDGFGLFYETMKCILSLTVVNFAVVLLDLVEDLVYYLTGGNQNGCKG